MVIAKSGDDRAYDDHCRAMLRFRNYTEARDVERVLKASLLMRSARVPEELPVTNLAQDLRTGKAPEWFRPYGCAAMALAAWRSDDAEGTLRWSRLVLESNPNERIKSMVLALQAMAQNHLGQSDTARNSLAEAQTLLEPAMQQFQPDALPPKWYDWLVADVLCREAAERLGATPTRSL